MFNCLPGAMLEKGHTHQWKKGFSCSRVLSQHNARMTASHRLFNPGPPVAKLDMDAVRASGAFLAGGPCDLGTLCTNGRHVCSAISVWEVGMLEAKGRLELKMSCAEWVKLALATPGLSLYPLTAEIAIESSRLPGRFHGDPADRILVATARMIHQGRAAVGVWPAAPRCRSSGLAHSNSSPSKRTQKCNNRLLVIPF